MSSQNIMQVSADGRGKVNKATTPHQRAKSLSSLPNPSALKYEESNKEARFAQLKLAQLKLEMLQMHQHNVQLESRLAALEPLLQIEGRLAALETKSKSEDGKSKDDEPEEPLVTMSKFSELMTRVTEIETKCAAAAGAGKKEPPQTVDQTQPETVIKPSPPTASPPKEVDMNKGPGPEINQQREGGDDMVADSGAKKKQARKLKFSDKNIEVYIETDAKVRAFSFMKSDDRGTVAKGTKVTLLNTISVKYKTGRKQRAQIKYNQGKTGWVNFDKLSSTPV